MTNEPAERLREMFEGFSEPDVMHADLDAALAAERRATVERMKVDVLNAHGSDATCPCLQRTIAILDAEAQR